MQTIPIFTYHHILPYKSKSYVRQNHLERHLRYLTDNNYHTLDCNELYRFLKNKVPLPPKSVMLTFDDGWFDNYIFVYPLIKKYNLKIVLFVNTDYTNKDGASRGGFPHKIHFPNMAMLLKQENFRQYYCNWSELKEMHQSGLVDIQSHTTDHDPYIKTLDDFEKNKNRIQNSLTESKNEIEKQLDKKCEYLAWPWGICDENYSNLAKNCGYKMMFSVDIGTNSQHQNLDNINRINVRNKGKFWFATRCIIYSSSIFSDLYLKTRI